MPFLKSNQNSSLNLQKLVGFSLPNIRQAAFRISGWPLPDCFRSIWKSHGRLFRVHTPPPVRDSKAGKISKTAGASRNHCLSRKTVPAPSAHALATRRSPFLAVCSCPIHDSDGNGCPKANRQTMDLSGDAYAKFSPSRASQQDDVVLLLRHGCLGLQRNRLADEVREAGQMLAFLV